MLEYIEWLAALPGLINVGLLVLRSIWNFPFGIVMVSLYSVIFLEARLYGYAGLQAFFLAIQIFGWITWHRLQGEEGDIAVRWSGGTMRATVLVGTAILAISLGLAMARYTDAAAPFPDAAIAMMSVTAQVLMVLRRIESWIYWIVVNVLSIGLFWTNGLVPTAGLYVVFLVLATMGLWQWLKAHQQQSQTHA